MTVRSYDLGELGPSNEGPPADIESDLSRFIVDKDATVTGIDICTILDRQKYHPIVLVGSSASGKTALLLSLITYFRNAGDTGLAIFFGNDFYSNANDEKRENALQFFNKLAADFMDGTTAVATKIGDAPLVIPVRITGPDRPEARFAFFETEGEWFQPDPTTKSYYRPFKPEITNLLSHYPSGITFVWVAPHTIPASSNPAYAPTVDPYQQMQTANDSLQGALANYEHLRSHNSSRDTHLLLVTKWDTFSSDDLPSIDDVLDRGNDSVSKNEVTGFLEKHYRSVFSTFHGLKIPVTNRSIFRYSAGSFRTRDAMPLSVSQSTLLSYPKDLWNWLHSSASSARPDVDYGQQPLIAGPPPKKQTLFDLIEKLFSWL